MGKGKGGGSSAPPAPDPYQTAGAQNAQNIATARETARLNRYNQSTPFGSVSWRATGNSSVPWEREVRLSPDQRRTLRRQNRFEQDAIGMARTGLRRNKRYIGQRLNTRGLPSLNTGDATRSRVEDALLARLQPRLDQQRRQLETQLSNQGFQRGTTGFNEAMDQYNRAQNDARYGAVLAGGQEQTRLFNEALSGRQQLMNERYAQRQLPLQEILALSGQANIVAPQGGPAPQVNVTPTDLSGLVQGNYNSQLNQYNIDQQRRASGLGEILGAAGSLFGAFM